MLEKFSLSKTVIYLLSFVLLLHLLGCAYQIYKTNTFIKRMPDASSHMGIFFILWGYVTLYLVAMYIWAWAAKGADIQPIYKRIQLIVILLLGVLPGLLWAINSFRV